MEQIIAGAGVSLIVSLFLYFFKKRFDDVDTEISEVEKSLNSFKLEALDKFVRKDEHDKDMNRIMEYIKEGFASIHAKLDKLESEIKKELDKKEDKHD